MPVRWPSPRNGGSSATERVASAASRRSDHGAGRSAGVQHLTLPPPLSSSERSAPIVSNPRSRSRAINPVAACGRTTCRPSETAFKPNAAASAAEAMTASGYSCSRPPPAVFGEGLREVRDRVVVEDGERGVQVAAAWVGQGQAHHRHTEEFRALVVCPAVGAEPRTRQDPGSRDQEVAFAFVVPPGLPDVPVAVLGEPVDSRRTSPPANSAQTTSPSCRPVTEG